MSVVIIDYGSGNLHSAAKAFEKARLQTSLDYDIKVSSDPDDIRHASQVVLPGVGAFADCKAGLEKIDGMIEAIENAVLKQAKPFLGICVGMQLMSEKGLEHGETKGFGWVKGQVEPIKPDDRNLKIPHMGWNTLNVVQEHPLFDGIQTGKDGMHAYFVHSYHMNTFEQGSQLALTEYGGPVTAAVSRDNMVGVQFHPEKSQFLGLKLIENFLKWVP